MATPHTPLATRHSPRHVNPMLCIRDLVKIYPGPVHALRGVSLDIGEGLFGLLGPNGAGKSTLMNAVAGLLEPTAGTITLDGVDIVGQPQRVRERLGYLPQEFGFYPDLSGLRMLELLLKLKGVDGPRGRRRIAEDLLVQVNLRDASHRKVGGYSGGMRQRLGLAQALAGNPRLIIVDEPTAGLDPEERHRFYRLLAETARGRIVLLSTHIVEDVATLCRRFAVIRHGTVVADTSPGQARDALTGQIAEGLVRDEELADFRAAHRVTQAVLVEGTTNRVRVQVVDGAAPPGFALTTPTLEDAYFVAMRNSVEPATGSSIASVPTRVDTAAPAAGASS